MSRIAILVPLTGLQIKRLRQEVQIHELLFLENEGEANHDIGSCEIVFGNPSPRVIPESQNLKWVQLESVGFGEYADLDWPALDGRITLTNLAGFFANPVAETALAGLLALGRGIDRLVRLQDARRWNSDTLRTELRLLRNASVVMVGFGAINQRLAELLDPFDCQITTIRSNTPHQVLDTALATADIVVCTAPDSPQTRGLFNAERLSRIPRTCVFANLGRGSIVVEHALANALKQGHLAGAVIDVTNDEPLPENHAFWTCPNTLITQHTGGGTADELDKKIVFFLSNLVRYTKGEPMDSIVDMARGY